MLNPWRARALLVAAAIGASIAVFPSRAAALVYLDQYYYESGFASCVDVPAVDPCTPGAAQTLTVSVAGYLSYVDLKIARAAATTGDLLVELRAGSPDGAILATGEPIAAASVGADALTWVEVSLDTHVPVDRGDVVAIVVTPDLAAPVGQAKWDWGGMSASTYYEGVGYVGGPATWTAKLSGGYDFAFATYVAPPIDRLDGPDRYATAVTISEFNYPADVPVVYIATGTNFPDALAGAAAAGHADAPMLLVPGSGTTLPPAVTVELLALSPDTIVILGGTGAVSASLAQQLQAYASSVVRLSGPNRYATAVAISQATYPTPPVGSVYIATGLAFPDALAAAAVAGRDDAPLLLVPGNQASLAAVPDVRAEILRLAPTRIVIAGGPGAVSSGIAAELAALVGPSNVVRYAGANRYDTAAAIAAASYSAPDVFTTYVATGLNFPDALAGAALAGRDEAPLLLVPGSAPSLAAYPLVRGELEREAPLQIVVFGGTGAVSGGIYGELSGLVWP